jgi:hypothetical protein
MVITSVYPISLVANPLHMSLLLVNSYVRYSKPSCMSLFGMWVGGPRRFQHESSPSHTDPDEPSFYDDNRDTPSRLLQGQVIHTAKPRCGSGKGEIVPKVTPALEASRWQWGKVKIIGATEVLLLDDMAQWTSVAPTSVGHINICKSQMTVMTM